MLQLGRWVLYDKDGTFVKAIASPQTYQGTANVEFGTYEFSCAYINFWDTDYIGMAFDLKTGSPKSCAKNHPSWKEAPGYFKDANCSQPISNTLPGYPPLVIQVGGSFYYITPNSPIVNSVYAWNAMQNTCTMQNLPGAEFHEYKPVPNWVQEIMDSTPYSMVLEY